MPKRRLGYRCYEEREYMRKFLIAVCAIFAITAGIGWAQEFTTSPRVAPRPEPPRAPVEQNSNSSWFKKFMAAPNKLQLINPWRTQPIWQRRTSCGCRPPRPSGEAALLPIVLHHFLNQGRFPGRPTRGFRAIGVGNGSTTHRYLLPNISEVRDASRVSPGGGAENGRPYPANV